MKRLIFPAILTVCYVGQALACAQDGDLKRAGYWLTCIAITWFAA